MKTDKKGHPIGFYLTGGEASDSRNFETLLDIGPGIAPRAVVADKGYDEVPPLSWTPKHLCFRSPQCRKNVPHTRPSSGGR